MNADLRTQYTRKVIQDAFFALLKEQPLYKIKVSDLCERAGINRSTFYRHYTDPFDLMNQLEEQYLSEFEAYVKEVRLKGLKDGLKMMIANVKESQEQYLVLVSDNADNQFINKMITVSYSVFRNGFEITYPQLTENQRAYLFDFMVSGCIHAILDWVNRGMPESPDDLAAFLADLYGSVIDHVSGASS